jgi:hypothetical protein
MDDSSRADTGYRIILNRHLDWVVFGPFAMDQS